jgi:hypothetical protein
MDIIASMMLQSSWLKFTDISLFTMRAVVCVCVCVCIYIYAQISNTEVLDPEESSPCIMYWRVLCGKVMCIQHLPTQGNLCVWWHTHTLTLKHTHTLTHKSTIHGMHNIKFKSKPQYPTLAQLHFSTTCMWQNGSMFVISLDRQSSRTSESVSNVKRQLFHTLCKRQ